MKFIKLLIVIILILLIVYFYKKKNVREHMSEGIYNLYASNEKLLDNLNNFTRVKMEEIINAESMNINEDVYNNKLCSNNICVSDKFIRDISNNKLTYDISANTIRPMPKIENIDIERYFTSFNNLINLNYMYSPLRDNYVFYDLSNNEISNIINIDNNSKKTDFLTRSPNSIFSDGTTQPTYLNSYFIDFNKTNYDIFTNTTNRSKDISGVQITVPDIYNTVWIKVLNSTNFDASFNKITSFMVKTSTGKYLGSYSNNSVKYIGLQPNGFNFSNLPYTWIPIYVGNNKNIVINGDLLLTNSDLTKVINNSYNINAYTTADKNCNQTAYNIPVTSLSNCIKSYKLGNVTSRDISGYMNNDTTNRFLNSFTGIAFSNNPYNHTKLSGYSLINPNSVKIKNTTNFDNTGIIAPSKLLGAQMYLVDLSNNPIINLNTININTNGFAVFVKPSPSTFTHSINKNYALFNIPIIVSNNSKILYFWLHSTIPDNLISFQLYYETTNETTNQTTNDVKYINNVFPISLLTGTNLYPIEYFNIKNMYGCILTNDDINNYFSQNDSIKSLDNNYGFLGVSLNVEKLSYKSTYPNEQNEIGIYEIGLCDYYENISF